MADKEYINLDPKTTPVGTELVPMQEAAGGAGSTKKMTVTNLKKLALSGDGSGEEILLKSPNGTVHKIRVQNDGVLTTQV